jgi:hypothetical protein
MMPAGARVLVLIGLAASLGGRWARAGECDNSFYKGFDSRVKARLVGRVAPGRKPVMLLVHSQGLRHFVPSRTQRSNGSLSSRRGDPPSRLARNS